MAHSFRSRLRHSALIVSLMALIGALPVSAWADAPMERQELAAALRQIQALERLIESSAASTPIEPGQRYHLDYPRLLADLARVRAGLQDYLTPARAQPRDLADLAGQYRRESGATDETGATSKPGRP